ncbi:AI-2E family transporter [Patescibacteria group bacterium]|nr:AI-2E family transporter [Patescibacteria group bacterium]MBU1663015.1 AI-2E family transporter [Patescibacteria group bacterium]MBU1933827.1 AI-2E family transporter [Patescibacteria group bacterium]MBU2007634.1 AI-2E family transporter [Patescibacteria group bacterium]MBU2233719.1 AI-2E family transporter [Patescibacteria group bacterium]
MTISNEVKNQKSQFYFLSVLLIGTLILSFYILRPFVSVFILAIIFTVVFQPLYRKILKYCFNHEGLAALLTTIIVVIIILTPLTFLGMRIFQELRQLYVSLIEGGGKDNFINVFNGLLENFRHYFLLPQKFSINLEQYLKQGLNWLLNNLGALFSNFASILGACFIFLISFYYLLKDGQKLKQAIIKYSPLVDTDDEMILNKLELAISSIVKGNFTVAFLQGFLTCIGFTIFAVPNAILWGTIACIAAFVPSIGTSIVFTPVIILMFVSGHLFSAIGLLLWGALAVGLIDNFLGPKLIGRGMKLHPLLILFSAFGGLVFLGPIGFILGPIVLSLLFALLHIYFYITNNGNKGAAK